MAKSKEVKEEVILPRGLRNNNPGNIRESPDDHTQWVGERATNDDKAFEEFVAPEYGIRAMAVILYNTYYRRLGLKTVEAIISRWAPGKENDTKAYIKAVAGSMDVKAGDELNLADRATMVSLIKAIIMQENGEQPYEDSFIGKSVDMAK